MTTTTTILSAGNVRRDEGHHNDAPEDDTPAPPATTVPVGVLELWAVGPTANGVIAVDRVNITVPGGCLRQAKAIARAAAHCRAKKERFRGGRVQVTDSAGQEWFRVAIPTEEPVDVPSVA